MVKFKKEELENIPALYSQEKKKEYQTRVYFKAGMGNYVWLITEYSPEDEIFFAFVSLNDVQCAELGYVSKAELEDALNNYNGKIEAVDLSLKEAKEKYVR